MKITEPKTPYVRYDAETDTVMDLDSVYLHCHAHSQFNRGYYQRYRVLNLVRLIHLQLLEILPPVPILVYPPHQDIRQDIHPSLRHPLDLSADRYQDPGVVRILVRKRWILFLTRTYQVVVYPLHRTRKTRFVLNPAFSSIHRIANIRFMETTSLRWTKPLG